jgi:hypothetical protein
MWLPQKLPCHEDCICTTASDYLIRLVGFGDHPYRSHGDTGLIPNSFGELDLITGSCRDTSIVNSTAGRAVYEIYTRLFQKTRHFDGLLNVPAAVNPIGG